jgi:hypothetical protein
MPKKNYNRTKRTAKTNVYNSNTESVNIGRAPGVNTASQRGVANQQNNNLGDPENYFDPNYVGENFYNNVYANYENNTNIHEKYGSDIWQIYMDMFHLNLNKNQNQDPEYTEFIRRMRHNILIDLGFQSQYHLTPTEQMYGKRLRQIQDIDDAIQYAIHDYEVSLDMIPRNINLSPEEAIHEYNNTFADIELSNMNLHDFEYNLLTHNEPIRLNLPNNHLEFIPELPENLVSLNMDNNPLKEPYLSIYNQYKQTNDVKRLIRRVNDVHISPERIKAMENTFPQLPTNVIRYEIEPFLKAEGGRKKRKHKKTKKRKMSKRISK